MNKPLNYLGMKSMTLGMKKMSLEEKINHQSYVKEIISNIEKINFFLKKKAVEKNKLIFQKNRGRSLENLDINSFNLFDAYADIVNTPINRVIRTFRVLKKNIKYFLIFLSVLLPLGVFLMYFYRFEIMILFLIYDINYSFLTKFNSFIDNIVFYISDIYHSLILKVKSLSSY